MLVGLLIFIMLCQHLLIEDHIFFLAVLDQIHFILAGNGDIHESLDEFEI